MTADTGKILRKGVKKIYWEHSPESRREEGRNYRSSSHSGREICFVLKGESCTMLNGNVYTLAPGNCLFINSWIPHAFGYQKCDKDLLHLWIWFSKRNHHILTAVLMEILPGGGFRQVSRILPLPEELGILFANRLKWLEKQKEKDEKKALEFLQDPINSILAEFAFLREHEELLQEEKIDPILSVIQSIKTHIQMSNGRNISYEALEQYSGYSRSYLAHSFRKYTGISIGEYIDKVRLDYTESARKKGMTQKEIAYELGFSSPVNFWSWLRKHKK